MWVNVRKILLFMRDTCRIHTWSTQLFLQHKGIGSFTKKFSLCDLWLRTWKGQSSGKCSKLQAPRVIILEFLEKISCNPHKNSRLIPASSMQNLCEFGFVAWKKWNIHAGQLKIRNFPQALLYKRQSCLITDYVSEKGNTVNKLRKSWFMYIVVENVPLSLCSLSIYNNSIECFLLLFIIKKKKTYFFQKVLLCILCTYFNLRRASTSCL